MAAAGAIRSDYGGRLWRGGERPSSRLAAAHSGPLAAILDPAGAYCPAAGDWPQRPSRLAPPLARVLADLSQRLRELARRAQQGVVDQAAAPLIGALHLGDKHSRQPQGGGVRKLADGHPAIVARILQQAEGEARQRAPCGSPNESYDLGRFGRIRSVPVARPQRRFSPSASSSRDEDETRDRSRFEGTRSRLPHTKQPAHRRPARPQAPPIKPRSHAPQDHFVAFMTPPVGLRPASSDAGGP
jgi:hypothetical protein